MQFPYLLPAPEYHLYRFKAVLEMKAMALHLQTSHPHFLYCKTNRQNKTHWYISKYWWFGNCSRHLHILDSAQKWKRRAGLGTRFLDASSLDLFDVHSFGLFNCLLWEAKENKHYEILKNHRHLSNPQDFVQHWQTHAMLNFSCLPVCLLHSWEQLEGKDHVLFVTRSCTGCHWIKTWPHLKS